MRKIPSLVTFAALAWTVLYLSSISFSYAQHSEPQPVKETKADRANSSMLADRTAALTIGLDEFVLRLTPLTGEEMAELAKVWRDIVRAKTTEVVEAQVAVNSVEGDSADKARKMLFELTKERNDLLERYSAIVDSWELKGGDEGAIKGFRAYRTAIHAGQIKATDLETLVSGLVQWLTSADGGLNLAKNLAIVAVSIYVLLLVARLARGFTTRRIGRVANVSKLLQTFLIAVVYWIVLSFGFLIVLSFLGIDITPLFALVGGASFIMGFALQDTLGNLANGLMIMINRPFDEGDFVDLGGVKGTVKSVNIVATTVITLDNQVIIIPNKQVWGNVITNVTASDVRRVDLTFGIGYDDDIPQAMSVLKEAAQVHPLVLDHPEPLVVVKELGDSSVNFLCAPWVKTEDYWTVYWDLMAEVKQRFDAAGISIPFPQRDVHLHTVTQGTES